jgi:hypothetical protein
MIVTNVGRSSKIDVDETAVIKMLGDAYMRRLTELASNFDAATGSQSSHVRHDGGTVIDLRSDVGKVEGTLLSPGLKLKLKDKVSSWPAGSLWVVVGPVDQTGVKLVHDSDDSREELVVSKAEMDGKFELR